MEQERYGPAAKYPRDVSRAGTRPLLQFPLETLETTAFAPGRDLDRPAPTGVSSRFVAYAPSAARLENHDKEGVDSDPYFGESNTFDLQAMATSPSVRNRRRARESLCWTRYERAPIAAGFEFLSDV